MHITKGNVIDYRYITTEEDLIEAVSYIKSFLLSTDRVIAVDTENYPLYNIYGKKASWRDPHTSRIRLIQIGLLNDPVPFIFDVLLITIEKCGFLIDLLMDDSIRKVFHFAIFDCKQFKGTFNVWLPNCWCTLVAANRVNVCTGFRAGQMRGNSLRALARDYFAIDLSKTEQSSDWSNPNLTNEQLEYAALDVGKHKKDTHIKQAILLELYYLFNKVLYTPMPNGFGGFCKLKEYKEPIEVDQAANSILAKIEYNGMPVSIKMLDLIYNTANRELEDLKLYLCRSFSLPLQQTIEYTKEGAQLKIILPEETEKTLNNPKKLVSLVNKILKKQGIFLNNVLSESLEYALTKLKIKEKEEEEEDEFYFPEDEGIIEWNIEVIDKLIKYKELSKLVSIDYRELINPVTGRIHSSYNCIGASTGRMSSGGKDSFNSQNVSLKSVIVKYLLSSNPYTDSLQFTEDKEVLQSVTIRHAFVVDKPGRVFVSADFSAGLIAY